MFGLVWVFPVEAHGLIWEIWVGWDGLGVLLSSAGNQISDVEFVPRTNTAVHDTAQTNTVMDVLSLPALMIRKACRVDRKQISRSACP